MGNQKCRKKLCSFFLAFSLAAGSLTGITSAEMDVVQAATNKAPGKPTGLKTELMKEAYGLNTKNPAFSWIVNDEDSDEVQSAYRIIVSKTSNITEQNKVCDTGWVVSEENSYVHVPSLKNILQDNQIYYWQVQTKDKDGAESPLSDAAVFMTDIASEWQSTDGIWAVPGEEASWTDYTVEASVSVQSGNAFAVLLRMNAGNSGYMLQIRDQDNVVKCHPITNGNISTAAADIKTVSLTGSGITLPTNKSEFKIKFTVEGTNIGLAVDTTNTGNSYKEAGTISLGAGAVAAGAVGFRTGNSESGTVDNLKVTGKDGSVLYENDFTQDDGFFSKCSVSNGKLSVGKAVFSVWSNPDELKETGNISFIRSPKIMIENKANIEKVIVSAAARGTAQDRGTIFDIYFNDRCLGAGSARELSNVGSFSGASNYTQVYYNSYDVTDDIVQGDGNVISAVANCRDNNRGILVQMTAFYKDGSKKILTNSGTAESGWKTLDGTKAFGDAGSLIDTGYVRIFHDNINMNVYPEGWNEASFDDSKWQAAKVSAAVADSKTGTSGRVLYPSQSENALRMETKEPEKRVYENNAGNIVVDLGKEIIGGLKVNIESSAAQKITVYMGEEMNGDGVKHKLTAVPDYVDTWTLKSGLNAFETITFRTFRYVELIGLDETTKQYILEHPDSVKGWAIQQEFDETDSDFAAEGSDEADMLNRLYDFCKYTIQATNQDVFVDSQARERAPYEGDLLVNSNTSYAVSGNYSLARHSNEWLIDNPTWPNDYSLFSVEMSYWDYIYTGNTDSIQENYRALKNKLTTKVASEDSATGLIRVKGGQAGESALIDWPTSERDGYQGSYYDVVMNAEYVGIYRYMAAICTALDQLEDAEVYTVKADKLQNSLITYAYDKTNGRFYDSLDQSYKATQHSSTHATAYALTYGVFDSQEMADDMCAFVYDNCKEEFKGSVYVTYFILKGLYTGNHGEMAQKLMTNARVGTNVKTFASLLDNLYCTITPEAWGHAHKNNMTLSHPWGASPGCSIVQGLFGILPLKAGFKEFSVKLQPGGIPSASVTTPTIKGKVQVSYQNGSEEDLAGNKLTASVTVPANTKAVVSLPVTGKEYAYLMVDGVKTEADYDGTYLSVSVGSGTHTFAISEEKVNASTYFDMKVSAGTSSLQIGDTTQIVTALANRENQEITGAAISYQSQNPKVVTVSETGVVKAAGSGKADVLVTASYEGVQKTKRLSFTVKTFLERLSLSLSGGNTITVDSSAEAVLKKVYSDGRQEAISSGIAYSVEGDAIQIDKKGTVTAKKVGTAMLTAYPSVLDKDSLALPAEISSTEVWHFDGTANPFNSGVTLSNNKLSVPVSTSENNTAYQGNVVSGTFEIQDVAATVAFNVKDNNNRYFWQFSKTEGLKRHTEIGGSIVQYGSAVPITLKDGENTFMIATRENRIYTWLNGTCVDICDTHASLPVSGGFGVRTGRSETFTLSNISVGNDLSVVWAKAEITVKEKSTNSDNPDNPDNPQVKKATVKLNVKKLPLQKKKSTTALKASGMIKGDKVKNWKSSKPSVAKVNSKTGKITAKKVGTTKITVTTVKGATASCTIKVQSKAVKTTKLTVTNVKKKKLTLKKGKSFKLTIKRQPLTASDKVTYKSSKPSIAKVSSSGKITAKKKGKAVITVQSASKKKVKITVTVKG